MRNVEFYCIVEDNKAVAQVLAENILDLTGKHVQIFYSGKEFLKQYTPEHNPLVKGFFLDHDLQCKFTGSDIAQIVRGHNYSGDIISISADPKNAEKDPNFNGRLPKPFCLEKLESILVQGKVSRRLNTQNNLI